MEKKKIIMYKINNKKHIDASVKERPQILLVPSFVSMFYAINIYIYISLEMLD